MSNEKKIKDLIENINDHPLTRDIIKVFQEVSDKLDKLEADVIKMEEQIKKLQEKPVGFREATYKDNKKIEDKYNVKVDSSSKIVDVFQLHDNPSMNI